MRGAPTRETPLPLPRRPTALAAWRPRARALLRVAAVQSKPKVRVRRWMQGGLVGLLATRAPRPWARASAWPAPGARPPTRPPARPPLCSPQNDAEATTEKYGLEAGLFKVLTAKPDEQQQGQEAEGGGAPPPPSRTAQAKALLARYGSAYLITSISFAIVSFAACYALVSAGVDVSALLARLGLSVSDASERVGTAAIAYAAHKALSPVRFPPTVALTPVVARWLGKDRDAAAAAEQQQQGGDGSA